MWLNPHNGFLIAFLKDVDFEIKLPNAYGTYEDNFAAFKSLSMKLDFDVKLLYDNIEVQLANKEYCCIGCHSVLSYTLNLNQILHLSKVSIPFIFRIVFVQLFIMYLYIYIHLCI